MTRGPRASRYQQQGPSLAAVVMLPLFFAVVGYMAWSLLDAYVFGVAACSGESLLQQLLFPIPCPLIGASVFAPGFLEFARAMTVVGFPALVFLLLLRSYSSPSSSRSGRQIGARRS